MAFALSAQTLHADERSKQILNKITSTFDSYSSYRVDFSVAMDGTPSLNGYFIVSGDRYFLDVASTEVFSNGKEVYNFDKKENVITIESVNSSDKQNLLSSPVQMFQLYEQEFNHTYLGEQKVGSQTYEKVSLTPKDATGDLVKIQLLVNPTTKIPSEIQYLTDDESTAKINIKKVTPNVAVNDSMFTYDKNKYKNVEVIDFR